MTIQFPQQSGDSSSSKTPLKLVGSCNGLLCLFDSENIYLFNPAVNKFKVIPNSGVSSSTRVVFGFGFVAEIDDYKLVRLLYNRKEFDDGDNGGAKVPRSQVEVYTLSTNTWKTIEHDIACFIYIYASGAVLNGVVHWEASLIMDGNDNFILAFDLNAEAFREIKPHKICYNRDDGLLHGFIGVFKGCLSIFSFHNKGQGDQREDWDIWVMKEYGVADSWTKLFTIEWSLGISHPLRFAKNDKLLAVSNCGGLVLYDQKRRRVKHLHIHVPRGYRDPIFVSTYHVESLVLLNESNDAKSDVSDVSDDVMVKETSVRSKKRKAKGPSGCNLALMGAQACTEGFTLGPTKWGRWFLHHSKKRRRRDGESC